MALIRLRSCAGWSEPLLVTHTTLLEISCHSSFIIYKCTVLSLSSVYISIKSYHYNCCLLLRYKYQNFEHSLPAKIGLDKQCRDPDQTAFSEAV